MNDNATSSQTFLQKFLKGGAWSLFVRTFAEFSTLLLSMIIARLLAPEEVGIYFLVTSFVSVIVIFSLFGLNIAIVRIVSSSVATGQTGIANSAIIKSRFATFISSFVVALFLYFVGLEWLSVHVFKSGEIHELRLLISIWVVLWCMETMNAEVFRGFKQFHLAVFFTKFAPNLVILVISASLFFSSFEVNLHDYLKIVVFGWLCAVAFSSRLLRKHYLESRRKDDIDYKSIFSTSLPLWFTGWITFALPLMDLWILGVFAPADQLALYGAASRLILIISMPLFIVQAVVPALIAESYAENKIHDMSRGLQSAAALAFYPGLALCIVYLVFGGHILSAVFGEYYAAAVVVLQILTVGVTCRIFAASSQSLLNMTGHGKTAMSISLFSGTMMVAGCLYAGERFGMVGVAIASTTAISIHNLLNLLFARVRIGIWVVPWFHLAQIRSLVVRS